MIGLKGFGWLWPLEFFGILRCVQDDSVLFARNRDDGVLLTRS
jgi:hypothetical protein